MFSLMQYTSHYSVLTKISFLALLIIFLYLSLPFTTLLEFSLHIISLKTLCSICHCNLSKLLVSDPLLLFLRNFNSLLRNLLRSWAVLIHLTCWFSDSLGHCVPFPFFFELFGFSRERDVVNKKPGGKLSEDTGSENKI